MATVDTEFGFPELTLSRNLLNYTTYNTKFNNNINPTFDFGLTSEDLYTIYTRNPNTSLYYKTELYGTFLVDVAGLIVGGTVLGVVDYVKTGQSYTHNLYSYGLSISATDFLKTFSTPTRNDDLAILTTELSGPDSFYLSEYNDYANGYDGNDFLFAGGGDDILYGGRGDDQIYADIGNDWLDGGLGRDYMGGGAGNDTYVTDGLDTILDYAAAGTDTVRSSVSYTLGANLENLVLTASTAINGTGNTLNNVITGNSAANTLNGGIGNDTLNGGLGNDRLIGGVGNDIYVINGGDAIVEAISAGTDTVRSSVSYTLGANLENLILTGSAAINGTGNTLNNVITGNAAANTLNGATGADRLSGSLGNDTYITDGGDTITEALSAGTDTVRSSVSYTLGANLENLILTGSAAINATGNTLNNAITGNGTANTLNGGIGNDRITGGLGKDTLVGGVGADTFVFNTITDSTTVSTTWDIITDFTRGQDKIDLRTIDAFGPSVANDAFLWKGTAAFSSASAGEARYQKYDNAGTANDYTVVFLDNDADTAVEMAIRLNGLHNLAATDFML